MSGQKWSLYMTIPKEAVLLGKIRELPADKVAEVEDFVEFLRLKAEERTLTQAATKVSEPSFADVWDNPSDAEYDKL
jgi:hypothetical protein